MNQDQFERNVVYSFARVKEDMYALYDHVKALYKEVDALKEENTQLRKQVVSTKAKVAAPVVRTVTKRAKKRFVVSKTTGKVHESNCAFAKNVKRENKQVFSSAVQALKEGSSTCKCVA